MEQAASLSPQVRDSLRRLRDGSMMLVISMLLTYTAFVVIYLGAFGPLVSASRYAGAGLDFLDVLTKVGEEILAYFVLGAVMGLAGLVLLFVAALGPLVSGCDGLASWSISFRTGARLFHLIRTGIIILIAGVFILFITAISPLAAGILLLVLSILALVLSITPRIEETITFISAIPKVFIIYFAVTFLVIGVLGIVFQESLTAGLIGAFILLLLGLIFLGISFVGLSIVFIQIGRVFKSTAMIIAGILLFFPLLSFASLVIASMEIPVILTSIPSTQSG